MTDTIQSPLVGKVLAKKYRLLRPLSEGGMGQVFLAELIHDPGEYRAVKIIRAEIGADESMRKRFLREVKVTRRISKENSHVVFVYDDYGFEEYVGYYVMELLQGTTLTARIKNNPGQLALPWALRITAEVCSAMETAHSLEIVHRDLKPDNIFLITYRGQADFVKVVDFGIAKEETAETKLTEFGKIAGTLFYMSPEQITGPSSDAHKRGEKYLDGRSDIYSLGCILFEMLTGRPPFLLRGENSLYYRNLLLLDHIQTPAPAIQELRPEVPDDLAQIVEKSLSKSPENRFPTMEAFADALMSVTVFDATVARPIFPRVQRKDIHEETGDWKAFSASTASFSSVNQDESFKPPRTEQKDPSEGISVEQLQKGAPGVQTNGWSAKQIASVPTHLTASAEMSAPVGVYSKQDMFSGNTDIRVIHSQAKVPWWGWLTLAMAVLASSLALFLAMRPSTSETSQKPMRPLNPERKLAQVQPAPERSAAKTPTEQKTINVVETTLIIESHPTSATFVHENKTYTTPCYLKGPANQEISLIFAKPGYQKRLCSFQFPSAGQKLVRCTLSKEITRKSKPTHPKPHPKKKIVEERPAIPVQTRLSISSLPPGATLVHHGKSRPNPYSLVGSPGEKQTFVFQMSGYQTTQCVFTFPTQGHQFKQCKLNRKKSSIDMLDEETK